MTHAPNIRLLGTTWIDRGWRYWNRRFWLGLLYALVAAFEVALAFAIRSALMRSISSPAARFAVSVAFLLLLIGGFVWAFRTFWKIVSAERRNDIAALRKISQGNSSKNRAAAGSAGIALGMGARSGIAAAALPLVAGTFAVVGWAFVIFLMGLLPYLSVEEFLAAHDLKESKQSRR